MNPFFKRKEKHDEAKEAGLGRIKNIFFSESVLKQDEYEGGRISLTEKFLLWETKKKSKNAIIPRDSIKEVNQVVKFRKGMGIEVTCEDGNEFFFPFMTSLWVNPAKKAEYHTNYFNGTLSWIKTLQTGIPSTVFLNIAYKGGDSSYQGEEEMGYLLITPMTLVFQEERVSLKGATLVSQRKGTQLLIPLTKIQNMSLEREGKSKLLLLLGIGGVISFLARKNYLLIEYDDEQETKQTPIFDFSPDITTFLAKDLDDKRKNEVIEIVKKYFS